MTKEFSNAKVTAAANTWFDGKVTSRTVFAKDGRRCTLGVMLPGEKEYTTCTPGMSCCIPANSGCKMIVREYVDYCCSYEE